MVYEIYFILLKSYKLQYRYSNETLYLVESAVIKDVRIFHKTIYCKIFENQMQKSIDCQN